MDVGRSMGRASLPITSPPKVQQARTTRSSPRLPLSTEHQRAEPPLSPHNNTGCCCCCAVGAAAAADPSLNPNRRSFATRLPPPGLLLVWAHRNISNAHGPTYSECAPKARKSTPPQICRRVRWALVVVRGHGGMEGVGVA